MSSCTTATLGIRVHVQFILFLKSCTIATFGIHVRVHFIVFLESCTTATAEHSLSHDISHTQMLRTFLKLQRAPAFLQGLHKNGYFACTAAAIQFRCPTGIGHMQMFWIFQWLNQTPLSLNGCTPKQAFGHLKNRCSMALQGDICSCSHTDVQHRRPVKPLGWLQGTNSSTGSHSPSPTSVV